MVLNWGINKPNFKKVKQEPDTVFEFKVKGKLGNEKSISHLINFKGFSDGIKCTDFGQGNVAVLGIKNGNPVLETNKGDLEITDNSLSVGCNNCIRIMDEKTKSVIQKYLSPSWDFSLVGLRPNQLSYDKLGNVYLSKNKKCLKLPQSGLIFESSFSKCKPLQEMGNYSKKYKNFTLQPNEWLFKLKESSSVLFLNAGACT